MQTRELVLHTGAAALALGLLATTANAQESCSLRFNHVLGPNEPFHQGFLDWAERVEERTDGQLTIDAPGADLAGIDPRSRSGPHGDEFRNIYTGLQSRAVDGAELVYPNITAANLNEVLDYRSRPGTFC